MPALTLETLNYFCIDHGERRVFFNLKSSWFCPRYWKPNCSMPYTLDVLHSHSGWIFYGWGRNIFVNLQLEYRGRWERSSKNDTLKTHTPAKIIKKSVILFLLLNMTVWCKHVHRLKLHFFFNFVLRIYQLG